MQHVVPLPKVKPLTSELMDVLRSVMSWHKNWRLRQGISSKIDTFLVQVIINVDRALGSTRGTYKTSPENPPPFQQQRYHKQSKIVMIIIPVHNDCGLIRKGACTLSVDLQVQRRPKLYSCGLVTFQDFNFAMRHSSTQGDHTVFEHFRPSTPNSRLIIKGRPLAVDTQWA